MAAIYSAQLAKGSVSAGVLTTVYTPPAAGVTIVRDIRLTPLGASPNAGYVLLNGGENVFAYQDQASGLTIGEELRVVLLPADVVQVLAVTQSMQYIISGYVLVS